MNDKIISGGDSPPPIIIPLGNNKEKQVTLDIAKGTWQVGNGPAHQVYYRGKAVGGMDEATRTKVMEVVKAALKQVGKDIDPAALGKTKITNKKIEYQPLSGEAKKDNGTVTIDINHKVDKCFKELIKVASNTEHEQPDFKTDSHSLIRMQQQKSSKPNSPPQPSEISISKKKEESRQQSVEKKQHIPGKSQKINDDKIRFEEVNEPEEDSIELEEVKTETKEIKKENIAPLQEPSKQTKSAPSSQVLQTEVKNFVKNFLHPYITGQIKAEDQDNSRTPMSEQLMQHLEKSYTLSEENKKEIKNTALNTYFEEGVKGWFIHQGLDQRGFQVENLDMKYWRYSPIYPEKLPEEIVNALVASLDKDFPGEEINTNEEAIRNKANSIFQDVKKQQAIEIRDKSRSLKNIGNSVNVEINNLKLKEPKNRIDLENFIKHIEEQIAAGQKNIDAIKNNIQLVKQYENENEKKSNTIEKLEGRLQKIEDKTKKLKIYKNALVIKLKKIK